MTLAEIKLDMTDNKYNSSALMLRDRMPELNYRYFFSLFNASGNVRTSVLVENLCMFCLCFSISVVCASRESVRDLMLGVEETGMLDTGQYVFINIGQCLLGRVSKDFFFILNFAWLKGRW